MVDVLVVDGADATTGEARREQVGGDLDVEGGADGFAARGQHLVERDGLGHRAREAIEDGTAGGIRPAARRWPTISTTMASGTRPPDSTYLRTLAPERVVTLERGPEELARGDVRQAEAGGQAFGLRALAGARGAQQDDDAAAALGRAAGPAAAMLMSPDEPLVVAHHQLCLELLHRLHDHGDDDEDRRAAEGEGAEDAA